MQVILEGHRSEEALLTFSRVSECIWSINDCLQIRCCSEAKVHTYIHLLAARGDVTKMTMYYIFTLGQLMNRDILLCMWHALLERAILYRY